jgi:predicted MFS family arabinose efflux permease
MTRPRASPNPSSRSLRGLDALSFLMADVRDGLGPFLSVFLKGSQNWPSGQIGIVMAASGIAAALAQVPAGMLVDSARAKRLILAIAALCVAAGCLLISRFPVFSAVLTVQIAIGLASAVIPPCLAALSLGLVGHGRMPSRVSRNEGLNHAGNFVAAVLAGGLGQFVGVMWLFYLVCLFSVGSAVAVLLIRPHEVDHDMARGGETQVDADAGRPAKPMPLGEFWRHRTVVVFLIAVVLFHFGNAAMLPLAGQMLAKTHPGTDVIALSACVIAAQFVMIFVAMAVGHAMRKGIGRKPIFLVAFAVLPVRGLLFTLTSNPYAVVGIQLLDGIAAGIFGVIAIVIASDVTHGTGRFNVAQGAVSLAIGIGAALSQLTGGFVAEHFGFAASFLTLAAVAGVALVFFLVCMPETARNESAPPFP